MATKVVVNTCFGGFGLSDDAIRLYAVLKGITLYERKGRSPDYTHFFTSEDQHEDSWLDPDDLDRADPALVEAVETLGKGANGWAAQLRVVEIAKGEKWRLREYDGVEHIELCSQVAWQVAQ